MSILQIELLQTGYDTHGHTPLVIGQGISFSLAAGELVCLLGANGSGKSTLIRSIAGLQPVLAGQVLLHNRFIADYSAKELSRKLGIVLTEIIDDPYLTVFDLLSFARYSHTNWRGTISEIDLKIINDTMSLTGVNAFRDRRLSDLSDGERQRIMITRALVQESELILLDEPTSFLDVAHRLEIFQLLKRLSREGRTFLLSTHDLNLALAEADRLLILDTNGLIEGCPEQLVLNGTIERLFVRSGMSFDLETAEFKLVRQYQNDIFIRGSGIALIWTKKALNRELWGISAGRQDSFQNIMVEVLENQDNYFWKLHTKEREQSFSDLTTLLAELKLIRCKAL